MTKAERKILQNLVNMGGDGPDRPVLQRPEAAGMMRKGWIQAVKPEPEDYRGMAVPLPFVFITDAGREALAASK